jgi:cytochrome c oxidase cbb3-type subunit 4
MMDTYTTLRHFADSWGLLAMTLAFLGIILWALRPGARAVHADTAAIPFRHEHVPAGNVRPMPGSRTEA